MSEKELRKIFAIHHQQYTSSNAWREALIKDIMELSVRDTPRRLSREDITRVLGELEFPTTYGLIYSQRDVYDSIANAILALQEPQQPKWCSHIEWDSEIGHWFYKNNPIDKDEKFCSRCGTKRPGGEHDSE